MTKRTDHYARALVDATYITDKLAEAEKRMMDARPGLPGAQAFDSPSVSGGTSSSPTERHALNDGGDRTRADIAAMDQAVREIGKHTAILRRLVDAWTPHTPTAKDKAALAAAVEEPTDCEHCTKAGIYEPAAHTGTVSGNLPHPMRLCSGCYRDVYRSCRLPKAETCLFRHERGKDPMVKVEA